MGLKNKTARPSKYQIDEQWYEQYSPALMYGARLDATQNSSPDGIQGAPVALEVNGVPIGTFNVLNFPTGTTIVDSSTPGISEATITPAGGGVPTDPATADALIDAIIANATPAACGRLVDWLITCFTPARVVALLNQAPGTTNGQIISWDSALNSWDIAIAAVSGANDTQTGLTGTTITLPIVPPEEYRLYRNGVMMNPGSAGVNGYTIAGAVVTLVTAASVVDTFSSYWIDPLTGSSAQSLQTGIVGAALTVPSAVVSDYRLYKNGVLLDAGGAGTRGFTRVGTAVTLVTPAVATDEFLMYYDNTAPANTPVQDRQTGLTGTTVTIPSTPLEETRIYRNGVWQDGTLASSSGTTVTFITALVATDIVDVHYNV